LPRIRYAAEYDPQELLVMPFCVDAVNDGGGGTIWTWRTAVSLGLRMPEWTAATAIWESAV
jgi:hypothetical protein